MKSIEIGGARLAVVAIALAVGGLAYAEDQSSGAETSGERAASTRAGERETAIGRANLVNRVEAAMGDAFGGVWFDSTARLHVGVTSPASRQIAEAVAARAGLSEVVVGTPVASSWSQLVATQERWTPRLADLFAQGTVRTSIATDRNSLEIELGSAVPTARRIALEREAAAANVEIEVVEVAASNLFAEPQAQCNEFSKGANCEPPLVGGVQFQDEAGNGCTTGPTVRKQKPANNTIATETFVLTAGHCIYEKGLNEKWNAFTKAGTKKEVGKAVEYLYGGGTETDVGVVEVKTGNWAEAKNPPLPAKIAWWSQNAETNPLPVIKQEKPAVTAKVCISGSVSGTVCGGEIISTTTIASRKDPKDKTKDILTKNLIRVKGITGIKGDSGAPWFLEAPYQEENTFYVEGIHHGKVEEGNEDSLFQSLETSFERLKTLKKLDLELLTTKNEKRHTMTSTSYPQHLTTTDVGEADKIEVAESVATCSGETFTVTLSEAVQTLSFTPEWKDCKTEGAAFNNVTVTHNGCALVFHTEPEDVSLTCPTGKVIEMHHYGTQPHGSSSCTLTIAAQAVETNPTYTNESDQVAVSGTADMTAQTHGACSFGFTLNQSATYTYSLKVSATSGAAIDVG